MVLVTSGINPKGEPCEFYIHSTLKENLDEVVSVVDRKKRGKDWDYIALVCGMPGTGKSNFAQTAARYCCEWFDLSYIAFTAQEFIEITSNCPPNSSVILDESFAAFNTRNTMSPEFMRVINHLQLIRQKNLYVFLCLPNFFDLAKGIAIYRSQNLFVCYSQKFGDRGSFAAFGRDSKKLLYIKGAKYMDYNAEQPNFRGDFGKSKCIDQAKYEEMKLKHLKEQEIPEKEGKYSQPKNKMIVYLDSLGYNAQKIAEISGLADRTVYEILQKQKGKMFGA